MPISKLHQQIYEDGISEGKEIVADWIGDSDLDEIISTTISDADAHEFGRAPEDEYQFLIKNFIDGIEDGFKLQLKIALREFLSLPTQ